MREPVDCKPEERCFNFDPNGPQPGLEFDIVIQNPRDELEETTFSCATMIPNSLISRLCLLAARIAARRLEYDLIPDPGRTA